MRLPGVPPLVVEDETWAQFSAFHEGVVTSGDVDPVYPVLHQVLADIDADEELRAAALVIYVAYYHLGSGLVALERYMAGTRLADLPVDLPTGTERRAHRSHDQFRNHLCGLQQMIDEHGSFVDWLAPVDARTAVEGFEEVATARVPLCPGNGRWAGYKTAELLWKVGGWNLRAETLGLEGSSGPLAGLRMLVGAHPLLKVPGGAERLGRRVVRALDRPELRAWPEQVETALCDFHAMAEGRYYVGHDIDQMQVQLGAVSQSSVMVKLAWKARLLRLPPAYLGEVGGWVGPDKQRKRAFRERGEVLVRA